MSDVRIAKATPTDIGAAVETLAAAFADDPITGFLLGTGPGYRERVIRFFSLLMRARVALGMPVFVARESTGIHGAAMGYSTLRPAWPEPIAQEWADFERSVPGFAERAAVYDAIAERHQPAVPHYYLGVIGTDPACQGSGIGRRLIEAFREASAADPLSAGVYLETANAANLRFYARAGFEPAGEGRLGDATLWCLFLRHARA